MDPCQDRPGCRPRVVRPVDLPEKRRRPPSFAPAQVLLLDVNSPQHVPPGNLDFGLEAQIVGDAVDGLHRVFQSQIVGEQIREDRTEDQRGGPIFQQCGPGRPVGITDQQVQATILLGVAERFLFQVQDGAMRGRITALDAFDEVVRWEI